MEVRQIDTKIAKPWIMNKHYAHRMPQVQYAFGLFNETSVLCGIVTYGQTNSPTLRKNICGADYAENVLELNRLCIESDNKNAASMLIGRSLKLLPKPSVIVSFSDITVGHVGYVYQATNWIYTGAPQRHNRVMTIDGKDYSPRNLSKDRSEFTSIKALKAHYGERLIIGDYPKKHRYVIFLGSKPERKLMRKALKYSIKPYPKGETKRHETEIIEENKQGELF